MDRIGILRYDVPHTLQGRKPTLHKRFFRLVNETRDDIKMDLMTNLKFDVVKFIRSVPLSRFTREAPYAAIWASYHHDQSGIEDLIEKTMTQQDAGFRVGLYGIELFHTTGKDQ
jgi:hypothetical protein